MATLASKEFTFEVYCFSFIYANTVHLIHHFSFAVKSRFFHLGITGTGKIFFMVRIGDLKGFSEDN